LKGASRTEVGELVVRGPCASRSVEDFDRAVQLGGEFAMQQFGEDLLLVDAGARIGDGVSDKHEAEGAGLALLGWFVGTHAVVIDAGVDKESLHILIGLEDVRAGGVSLNEDGIAQAEDEAQSRFG